MREEGCRFRDIAVAAPDFEEYAPAIEHIFARYGVPVFFSRRTDILKKPVPALILSALAVRTENYTYEAVFRYLKTGLTGIPAEDCSLLENYVLKWDIRGASWARGGLDDAPARLQSALGEETKRCFPAEYSPPDLCAAAAPSRGKRDTVRAMQPPCFASSRKSIFRRGFRTDAAACRAGEQQLAQEYASYGYSLRRAYQCVDILGDTPMDLSFLRGPFLLLLIPI